MDVARDHIIHSRGGKLGADVSSVADVQRIVANAVLAPSPRGLVIHFHGGLVNTDAGLQIAGRLAGAYQQAGTYPVFFVWESGLVETIRNNLGDILHDKVFHELLKKVGEWVLKEGAGSIATRGAGQTINEAQLRTDFDRWLAGETAVPPVAFASPGLGRLTRAVEPDEDELAARIEAEIETDPVFERTMAGLAVASGRVSAVTTRGAGIHAEPVEVLVDQAALESMFPPRPAVATRGGIPWLTVAKFLARVTIGVLGRFRRGRDHGGYVTIVEEVLRAAYLAKVGEVIWRQMKKDTADSFQDPGDFAGTALLNALADQKAAGRAVPSITLIGHSTGAVYINQLLHHAVTRLPGVQFAVLFLAPACRCEDFATTLRESRASIADFRMFAMHDDLEQNDHLVPIVYPRSLLYLISGVLEGSPDVPIAGMERFIANEGVFGEADFPDVARLRTFLSEDAKRHVWALVSGAPGLSSASTHHGDFDNDAETVNSLAVILKNGF